MPKGERNLKMKGKELTNLAVLFPCFNFKFCCSNGWKNAFYMLYCMGKNYLSKIVSIGWVKLEFWEKKENWKSCPGQPTRGSLTAHKSLYKRRNQVPFAAFVTKHQELSNGTKFPANSFWVSRSESAKWTDLFYLVVREKLCSCILCLNFIHLVKGVWKWCLLMNCSILNLVSNAINHSQFGLV